MGEGGGDELLAERDAISGGLVDTRKGIEFWLERSHVLFRHLYGGKESLWASSSAWRLGWRKVRDRGGNPGVCLEAAWSVPGSSCKARH
jgi:hypothetical protein